ncbi:PQQ-dependent sugar dehydrogenase [Marinicella meishanensis]|uniref:PQQ-dependent sugar dehydrogenase n=1 Tax=Marinicella meishanensis TaxID=2873263 RepID=UPI001CC00163|nr:PQQ-dependent sugar dehydrogenase [Marinicella sp. NBU2979]
MKKICLLIAAFWSSTSLAQVPTDVGLELVNSVSGNMGVRHAGDGSGRLFVINQDGAIRVIDDQDNLLATPFLDIDAKVNSGGNEQGLLGLAFHPNYSSNGYFYVNYTKSGSNSGDTIIERYSVSAGDANVADPNSGVVIMRVIQDFANHNGGNILFGPDGYLYIGMGDGGSGGDPLDRGLNLGSALGSMLRIDVDGNNAPNHPAPVMNEDHVCPQDGAGQYGIPADNPFVGTAGACPEIWTYGLRNPWRWSFDRDTGDMFIGDVGQGAREEISFQPANGGGENFGWNCREGDIAYNGCPDSSAYTAPILVKTHGSSRCSITGGYRYRGPVGSIQGDYIYGDYCSGQIWFANNAGGPWTEDEWSNTGGVNFSFQLTSFGEDEDGNVYIVRRSGDIYRITGDPLPDDLIFASDFE